MEIRKVNNSRRHFLAPLDYLEPLDNFIKEKSKSIENGELSLERLQISDIEYQMYQINENESQILICSASNHMTLMKIVLNNKTHTMKISQKGIESHESREDVISFASDSIISIKSKRFQKLANTNMIIEDGIIILLEKKLDMRIYQNEYGIHPLSAPFIELAKQHGNFWGQTPTLRNLQAPIFKSELYKSLHQIFTHYEKNLGEKPTEAEIIHLTHLLTTSRDFAKFMIQVPFNRDDQDIKESFIRSTCEFLSFNYSMTKLILNPRECDPLVSEKIIAPFVEMIFDQNTQQTYFNIASAFGILPE